MITCSFVNHKLTATRCCFLSFQIHGRLAATIRHVKDGRPVQSENSFADGKFFCEGCIDEGRMGDGGKQIKKKMKKKNRWS